jgi:hypothetical protein
MATWWHSLAYGDLSTVVVQRAGRRASNARNGPQVLVNRPQILLLEVLKDGPRHHLQQVAVEGLILWITHGARRYIGGAIRMQMIEIHPGAQNLRELLESPPADGQTGLVGC